MGEEGLGGGCRRVGRGEGVVVGEGIASRWCGGGCGVVRLRGTLGAQSRRGWR